MPSTTQKKPTHSDSKMDRPSKRLKVSSGEDEKKQRSDVLEHEPTIASSSRTLVSLNRSITPPLPSQSRSRRKVMKESETSLPSTIKKALGFAPTGTTSTNNLIIPSPIQLTHIRDLPANSDSNIDTVKLRDILGDPMIRECWQFNYMFDVDFLMSQFDEDVRGLVKVKVVHGSWKRESPNRERIDEACSRYPNAEQIIAYMPEPFGTHHSKMMVLLRHDDLAQVVIHTANMIPGDWANMCQAVWRSPLLPLQEGNVPETPTSGEIGTGARFKRDLLSYLTAYGAQKTGSLVRQLGKYDFGAVRAALVASVPSKQKVSGSVAVDSQKRTLWGWLALSDVLSRVPIQQRRTPHVVIQISSIATLGQTDKWLKEVLFESLSPKTNTPPNNDSSVNPPKYSIIFPTPDEIRRSLNGYASGGSIHLKLQTPAQQKQLRYMRPYFCQWAGDGDVNQHDHHDYNNHNKITNDNGNGVYDDDTKIKNPKIEKQNAGRRRAAPHIKTYIRFSDIQKMDSIDWAMVTSANLSTQAWGAAVNASGEVRVCSWEIGVVVWPGLFQSNGAGFSAAKMVPCFRRDIPVGGLTGTGMGSAGIEYDEGKGKGKEKEKEKDSPAEQHVVVGLRMPYDLPLTPYAAGDVPWCATAVHTEPDWLGRTWED